VQGLQVADEVRFVLGFGLLESLQLVALFIDPLLKVFNVINLSEIDGLSLHCRLFGCHFALGRLHEALDVIN
jgi:hypothetical protein